MPTPHPDLWNRAWLYQRYVIEARRRRDIATEAGCSVRTVGTVIAHFGLQQNRRGRPATPQPVLPAKRQLAALYAEIGSTARLASHPQCSEKAVREAMDRFGIPRQHGKVIYNERAWFANGCVEV